MSKQLTTHLITVSEDLSRARYELELFLLRGEFDLFEDGRLIAAVGTDNCAADVSYGKLILSCWGEGWSRSWRIAVCEVMADRLRLRCTKRMGRTSCLVDLKRGEAADDLARSRSEYARKLTAMIESNLPAVCVERAVTARDDRRHLSGAHTRLVLNDRGRTIAGIGVGARESQPTINALLGAGIIWLDSLRHTCGTVSHLMLFAPSGQSSQIAARLMVVGPKGASVSLHEVDESNSRIQQIAAFDQGDLADNLRRMLKRAMWPRDRVLDSETLRLVDSILGLAPDLIESHERDNWITFSIRGLQFARVSTGRRRAEFGLGDLKKLDESTGAELRKLVAEIIARRDADSPDRNGFTYRAQAERWLESIIRRDVTAIDPSLDPRYVYSQVPAYRGEQRAFIDLLAATRDGRVAVIELKVAEDVEFPFQGVDYWLRVEWHRLRGDFRRRGYFKDLVIADAPPLLYLVAPLFRFHATTKLLAGSISERVPVYRIGINEDWRAGLRVLLSERLN